LNVLYESAQRRDAKGWLLPGVSKLRIRCPAWEKIKNELLELTLVRLRQEIRRHPGLPVVLTSG